MLKAIELIIIKDRGDNLDICEKITTSSLFIKSPDICKYHTLNKEYSIAPLKKKQQLN
jgi:hypothetical protein